DRGGHRASHVGGPGSGLRGGLDVRPEGVQDPGGVEQRPLLHRPALEPLRPPTGGLDRPDLPPPHRPPLHQPTPHNLHPPPTQRRVCVTRSGPERAPLYKYREGFPPFSGFSEYYERRFRFIPPEQDVARAAVDYFRSSPIPPDPRYIAPAVSQALYNPTQPVP